MSRRAYGLFAEACQLSAASTDRDRATHYPGPILGRPTTDAERVLEHSRLRVRRRTRVAVVFGNRSLSERLPLTDQKTPTADRSKAAARSCDPLEVGNEYLSDADASISRESWLPVAGCGKSQWRDRSDRVDQGLRVLPQGLRRRSNLTEILQRKL